MPSCLLKRGSNVQSVFTAEFPLGKKIRTSKIPTKHGVSFMGPRNHEKTTEGNLGLKNMQEENVTQIFLSQMVVYSMVIYLMVP